MPVLIGCSSVATRWFPPSQVILVTSIAAASNFVGTGFSFLFMCFAQDVPLAFLYQAVVSSVFFIFNLIIGKKEKTSGEKIELKEEMKKSLKNKTLMILVVFVSIPMSVYFAYGSIIGILLEQQGFGEFTTGLMGFVVTGSGMIGAIPATYLADVKKSTKSSLRVFMVLTILSSIALSALIHVDYLNYIASAVFGASITGSLPLGIRACIEFMNDVHESIPTNLIYLFGQIFGSFLTYPIQYFFLVSGQSGLWIASLFILLSYSFLLIFTRKVRGSGFGKEGFNSHNKDLGNNEKNWGSPSIGQQLM
jgi:predicted MFS family arabinose efflux permease